MRDSSELQQTLLTSLDDSKALNVVSIPLPAETVIADGLIIASGTSDRHLVSMAEKLQPILKRFGVANSKIEGHPASGWILLDAGDWIIHLFRPEVRRRYNLEELWDLNGLWAGGASSEAES